MTAAEQLLADLIDILDATVGREHGQKVEIITPNEEIAETVCARYNAARAYVLTMRGQPIPPGPGMAQVEPMDLPDDHVDYGGDEDTDP